MSVYESGRIQATKPFGNVDILETYPIHVAAQSGDIQCVEWLLALGAKLVTKDARGYTPLMYAAERWVIC